MNLDEALQALEGGGEMLVRETPLGDKLSATTPTGEDWHAAGDELEAVRKVMGEYEDVAVRAYHACEDGDIDKEEMQRALAEADVEEPWRVIGRVENIPVSVNKAGELATQND